MRQPEVDVSDWPPAGPEPMGSKTKAWLYEPIEDRPDTGLPPRWLWKNRNENTDRNGVAYYRGDDWTEFVAARLGDFLGVPTPTVRLAKRGKDLGSISHSFVPDVESELRHGNELVASYYPDHQTKQRGDATYTLQTVLQILAEIEPPGGDKNQKASYWFAGYLVLDAWIGNTDRHSENWGALAVPQRAPLELAPSFDHASSMGFLLSDGERLERLGRPSGTEGAVEWWADRATTPFANQPHPCVLAGEMLELLGSGVTLSWARALGAATHRAQEVFDEIPAGRISEPAESFALRLLAHNAERLLSALAPRM